MNLSRYLPLAALAALCCLMVSCANFRKLGKDLKLINDEYRISGVIENADDHHRPVRAVVIEWNRETNRIYAGDVLDLTSGGAFVFIVKSPLNQYVAAYVDQNRDGRYNPGEPLWLHGDSAGNPEPVAIDPEKRSVRLRGHLSSNNRAPADMQEKITRALDGKPIASVISHQGVRFAIGERASLDDPRFAATRGEDGLWTPATFAIQSGFGIYFLEPYDPSKTPVIFVHGAAGSPQDWSLAMRRLDRKMYQPWFYVYPSGMRLESAAMALNDGVKELHERYRFRRLHVVAHSMGGLVSRRFIEQNVLTEGNNYINTFISFSSPWDGHEAAAMGVKYAPEVVPSWRDMAHGSAFLDGLFKRPLKGRVNHHLFYSHRAGKSRILPPENDGTVSVASQLRKEAAQDAVEVRGFDEDHVSILSSRAALSAARTILDAAESR
jgi:pimeloyl-ACP methyl ester carboxylesterase